MSQQIRIRVIIGMFVVGSLIVSAYTLFQQSIRLDEAQSLWVSTKSVPAILNYVVQDVHVPFYELLLHFWLAIFGYSILWARVLSFLFFLASIPILFLIIKKTSSTAIALLTIALYSLSPFILWYSFEARMYSMFTFVTCLSHYFFLEILESKGKKGQVGYFFSCLFGLYIHYFFVLLLITQFLFLFILTFRRYQEQTQVQSFLRHLKKERVELLAFITPTILAVVFFIPWLIYFVSQGLASNTQPLIPAATTYNLFQTIINFLFGFQSQVFQSILVALWPLAVVPIFFLFSKRNTNTKVKNMLYFVLVTIIPVIVVFLISYYRPIYLTRYLIFVTPTFFFLLAWTLFHISKQLSAVVLSLFALLMFTFLLIQNISNATPVKEDYLGITTYLNTHAKPGDIVTISSPFTIYPIEYYYHGSAQIVTIPEWDVYKAGPIPHYFKLKLINQLKNYQSTYQNMYVVLSYDQGYESSVKKYLDTHYKRILLKKYSPGLELREYKLRY